MKNYHPQDPGRKILSGDLNSHVNLPEAENLLSVVV